MTSHPDWRSRAVSADEVLGHLRSGARAFVHGTSATPTPLLEALARRTDLEGVRLYHLHLDGPVPTADPAFDGKVRHVALFLSAQLRGAVAEGRADFVPIFLSDVPGLFSSGRVPLDAALLQLSPPDAHGLCTLGTSVEAARAAADSAKMILAEINLQMPRTHGNAFVPFEKVKAFTVTDRPLLEHHIEPEGPVETNDWDEDIAEKIELDIDELPTFVDADAARADTATRLHEDWSDNVFLTLNFENGFGYVGGVMCCSRQWS